MAHVNAFEYFGGSPRILVPDNCKTAVIKADKRDPRINASYEELEEAVRAENGALNSQPFSKLPGSRKQMFFDMPDGHKSIHRR